MRKLAGEEGYRDRDEKFLFYCGRDRRQKNPILVDTVIKVTGGGFRGYDIQVGGFNVIEKLDADSINDGGFYQFEVDPYFEHPYFEHLESQTGRLRERMRKLFGLQKNPTDRDDWVEDFMEKVFPRYKRRSQQKNPPPPILEKMYSNVGIIGHLDHGFSTLSRAVQGEPLTDWVSKHWKEYIAQTSDIDETIEDKEHNVIPVHLPGEPTQVPVFDEFGKPLKSEDPK